MFCFDGDRAGRQALGARWKTPSLICVTAVELPSFLPDGEDPDSLVRAQGSEAFEAREQREPLSDVLFDQLSADLTLARWKVVQNLPGRQTTHR